MATQKNIHLKVTGYDKDAKLFKVEFGEKEYQVRQTGNEIPEYLNCRVTQTEDEVEVTQEIEQYFHSGAIRRFTVRSDMRESAGVYELVDDCGFVVYLYGAEKYSFFKGKQLLCTVMSTEGARPYVTLREQLDESDSAFSISKKYLKGLFVEREWDIDSLCDLILYDGMDDPFDVKCYEWVISQTSIYREQKDLESFLCDVRGCCMDVIEKSDLLAKCAEDEVNVLQDRMTMIIEHMGYVRTALQTIADEKETEYINDIFFKLKNYDECIKSFEKIDDLKPNDYDTNFYLGYFHIAKGDQTNQAFNARLESINSQDEYQKGLKEVAAVYMQAVPYLERAHELNPENKDCVEYLKQLCFRLRDEQGMMEKYNKYNTIYKQQRGL